MLQTIHCTPTKTEHETLTSRCVTGSIKAWMASHHELSLGSGEFGSQKRCVWPKSHDLDVRGADAHGERAQLRHLSLIQLMRCEG